MKECPKCKAVTESHSECAVCQCDITDIEYSERQTEKYALNKYLLSYILKKQLFTVFCVVFVIAALLISLPNVRWSIFLICIILTVDSVTSAFYPQGKRNKLSSIYTDSFLDTHLGIDKYLTGGAAILIAFMNIII